MLDSEKEPGELSKSLVAAVAVLAVIAVVGVGALFTSDSKGPVIAGTASAAVAAPGGACPSSRVQMEKLTEPPAARWRMVGTMHAPESAEAARTPGTATSAGSGPRYVSDAGYRLCFEHSTSGALFAAVNFAATLTDGERAGRQALRVYLARGPQRDREIAETEVGDRIDEAATLQVSAYRIDQLRRNSVVVTLALLVEGVAATLEMQVPLVWESGDWRVQAPAAGSLVRPLPGGPDQSFSAFQGASVE